MSVTQADLVHVWRAIEIARKVFETSPELLDDEEYEQFVDGYCVVDELLEDKYKETVDEDTDI